MGAIAEDQAQEHHATQDRPRGEDLGVAVLCKTDLQLCFKTLTPLYYRLRKMSGSYPPELMGDSKLQMSEAWPRFTKSAAAPGDYYWDYCGSGRGRGNRKRRDAEEKNHMERTGRHYGNNQSLLPGLSVLEWS